MDKSFGKVAMLLSSSDKSPQFLEIQEILNHKKIDVNLVAIDDNGNNLLDHSIWNNIDRALIATTWRHKLSFGHIQGLLDLLSIPYTGSGMLAAALAGDLIKVKKIWQTMGIPTAPYIKWQENIDWQESLGLFGLPLAIKSIYSNDKRVFKVQHLDQLNEVLDKFTNKDQVIIEPWISGDEYVVHILANKPLLPLKINNCLPVAANASKAKHNTQISDNSMIVSASEQKLFQPEQILNINGMQQLALDCFEAISCSGIAAVHILRDINGDHWVLALDPLPLITKDSHFATAAHNSEIGFTELLEKILASSMMPKPCNYLSPTGIMKI
jgi:D-alanine-D-alanine ligase